MPLYAGKYAICAFLQNMRNMLQSHDRYKLVSLTRLKIEFGSVKSTENSTHLFKVRLTGKSATDSLGNVVHTGKFVHPSDL